MGYLYETHMHTAEVSACASSTAIEQVTAYKDRGYAGIIVTDHFINGNSLVPRNLSWKEKMEFFASGYCAAKAEGDRVGLDVFIGWEFTTTRGSDFLTYGLDLDFLLRHPGLDKLGIEAYSALVRENGGYLAQAHPYRDDAYIEYQFPVAPELLDGVEVHNASMPERTNDKTLAFAIKHRLPQQAGSDSHKKDLAFPASGVELERKAESIFDIINALKTGAVKLIRP